MPSWQLCSEQVEDKLRRASVNDTETFFVLGKEPATGEDTYSGPATVDVQDGGVGIRFNFPAVGKFRSISWDEWFSNFRQFDLLFVYQRDAPGSSQNARYRIVPRTDLPK